MELDMAIQDFLDKNRDNLKMGLAHGNFDDAIKIVFRAGFEKGIEHAVSFQQQTKTEEL
jgi:hypothetical protein